jgi:hypothetical protein
MFEWIHELSAYVSRRGPYLSELETKQWLHKQDIQRWYQEEPFAKQSSPEALLFVMPECFKKSFFEKRGPLALLLLQQPNATYCGGGYCVDRSKRHVSLVINRTTQDLTVTKIQEAPRQQPPLFLKQRNIYVPNEKFYTLCKKVDRVGFLELKAANPSRS